MALYRTGLYVKNHSVEKVQVAKTPIASYNGNVTGLYIPELIAYITAKQSGSGDPTPDNIRPIIGASECNVVRCGTNVWDEEWEVGSIDPANGTPSVANKVIRSKNFIPVKGSSTCYLPNLNIYAIFQYDEDYSFLRYNQVTTNTFSFDSDVKYIKFRTKAAYGTTYNNDISINYPSTDTSYHAYNGNIYTIQLGDTYYGGSLNVTNGVLTVNKECKIFDGSDDENWKVYPAGNGYYIAIPEMKIGNNIPSQSNILPQYSGVNALGLRYGFNNNIAYCYQVNTLSDVTDLASWKIGLARNNLQMVFDLETPTTIQLTPAQIEQLLGANNVWCDTGDVEVKFYEVIR